MGGNLDRQAQLRAVLEACCLFVLDLSRFGSLAAPLDSKPYGSEGGGVEGEKPSIPQVFSGRRCKVRGGMTSDCRAAPEQPDLHSRDQGWRHIPSFLAQPFDPFRSHL